jgi:hypothetical protein
MVDINRYRPSTFARNYVKLWFRRYHLILDGRNFWVVFGYCREKNPNYKYLCIGPFNYIVSTKHNGETDVWFRFYFNPTYWSLKWTWNLN